MVSQIIKMSEKELSLFIKNNPRKLYVHKNKLYYLKETIKLETSRTYLTETYDFITKTIEPEIRYSIDTLRPVTSVSDIVKLREFKNDSFKLVYLSLIKKYGKDKVDLVDNKIIVKFSNLKLHRDELTYKTNMYFVFSYDDYTQRCFIQNVFVDRIDLTSLQSQRINAYLKLHNDNLRQGFFTGSQIYKYLNYVDIKTGVLDAIVEKCYTRSYSNETLIKTTTTLDIYHFQVINYCIATILRYYYDRDNFIKIDMEDGLFGDDNKMFINDENIYDEAVLRQIFGESRVPFYHHYNYGGVTIPRLPNYDFYKEVFAEPLFCFKQQPVYLKIIDTSVNVNTKSCYVTDCFKNCDFVQRLYFQFKKIANL